MWQYAIFLEYPIDLLLFTPDDIPVIVPSLLPLTVDEAVVDCVFKGCFELDGGTVWSICYGGVG
jgi:hypothetical protein